MNRKPELSIDRFLNLSRKERALLLLGILSAFCCLLYIFRVIATGSLFFGFLPWNLFLAWLPFLLSWWSYKSFLENGLNWKSSLIMIGWLLFFPNAPYLITDLIHLGQNTRAPLWFDALLVFSFALTGLLAGLASLYLIHRIIEREFGKTVGWWFVFFCLCASGFGIYIGRILRWNSWDIFFSTIPLLQDIKEHMLYPSAIMMTATFTVFTSFAYLFLFFLIRLPTQKIVL